MMWRRPRPRDEALLVALAKRFRVLSSAVEARADFRSSLRTFLMMEASMTLVPDPSRPSTRVEHVTRLRPRRPMVIATGFVAAALGLGGVTSASATALPGEALYPVKRATERVELTFHRDLPDRGAFQLELAERRLDEARELSAHGPQSAELATESLRDFEEAAAAGGANLVAAYNEDHDRTSLVVLNRFTTRTDGVLNDLAAQLPGGGTALTDARDRLEAIDSHSEQLCPSCGGGSDESLSPPAASDGSDASDGSTDLPPAPEPEPEAPPSEAPPSEPAPATPPAVSVPSDESEDQDESDSEDQSDDSDDESQTDDEPLPSPTPTPVPTPTLTPPVPIPTPTPTPGPEPTPTEPPGGLLGIVPELLGETLDILL